MDIFNVGKGPDDARKEELEMELEKLKSSQRLYRALKPGTVPSSEVRHHKKLATSGNAAQRRESREFLQSVVDGRRLEEIREELRSLRSGGGIQELIRVEAQKDED